MLICRVFCRRYIGEILQAPTSAAGDHEEGQRPIEPAALPSEIIAVGDVTGVPDSGPVSNTDQIGSSSGPEEVHTDPSVQHAEQHVPNDQDQTEAIEHGGRGPVRSANEVKDPGNDLEEESLSKADESTDQDTNAQVPRIVS